MSRVMEKNQTLNDYYLKQKRFVAEFSITFNATPADKVHSVPEAHGVMLLRTEGKTSEVDAIETVSFTTAADNSTGNSVFGVMVRGGDSGLGSVNKVLKISVSEKTSLASALAVTAHGTNGLTTGGNVAFSIAGTGLDLSSESPTIVVEVEYISA